MSLGGAQGGFPVGSVLAGDGGLEVEITRYLRGDGAVAQYEGVDPNGGRGWGFLVTVAPEHGAARAELERGLALRVMGVAPFRAILSVEAPDGGRHDALVEGKPFGDPLVETALPLAAGDAERLAIDLAQIAEAVARGGQVLVGIRPELTFVGRDGGAPTLTAVMPRAELFAATAGDGRAQPPLFPDRYAAPEVVLGEPAAAGSDVFAICSTVAFAATGEHPFEGTGPSEQLAAMREGRRRPWRGPDRLGAVLARGMSAEPASRPALAALLAELRALTAPAQQQQPAGGGGGGLGSRLRGLFSRSGGGDSDDGDGDGGDDGDEDFPIGARIAGRDFVVGERLAGERWRGRYRGRDRAGGSVLITIAGEQTVKASQLRRDLEMNIPGIARLRHVGQVSGGPGAFDALVEDEPPGTPVADLTSPLGALGGLSLGISFGAVVERAHRDGIVIGAFFAELIYLTAEAGRLVVSGIAPRAERFVRTASRPNFALPDLFASVYHAPEVLAGGARSSAGDVFSLTALTAEWMSGQFPFDGDSYPARAVAIQMGTRRPLAVPDGARAFLERGLERDPARRPAVTEWLAAARSLFESLDR